MLRMQEVTGHSQDDDAVNQKPNALARQAFGACRNNDHDQNQGNRHNIWIMPAKVHAETAR